MAAPEPAPEFPVVPLEGTTELRIHGVSGTPVESMLHHPHPVQVTGDKQAGCYRRGEDHVPLGEARPGDRHLEAYSWGRLTAGSATRAMWLLLLPFMLANVASWAHPLRPAKRFAPVGAMSGLIRVFALTLTVLFMLATAGIGMDLVAWQCVNDAAECGSKHFFTRFMVEGPELLTQPGTRVALGALVPLAVLGFLWWVSHSTASAYEQFPPTSPEDEADASTGTHDFAHPRFWAGGAPFRRLRSLHVATALATVAGLVAYASGGTALVWAAALLAAFCAVMAFSPLSGRRRELLEDRPPPPLARVLIGNAQWAGVALVVAALWYAAGPATPEVTSTTLPGINGLVLGAYLGQWALIALYLVATWWALASSRGTAAQTLVGRTMCRGFGPVVLAVVALAVAGFYASGLILRVADYLGDPVDSCTRCAGDLVVYQAYWDAARVCTAFAAALVAVGIGTWWWRRRRPGRCLRVVEREYGVAPGDPATAGRVREIAKVQASAALTDRGAAILSWLVGLTIAFGVALRFLEDFQEPATTAGTWLIGVLTALFVLVGRSAYGSDARRRTVGILWDLGTFWPRAAHPFAPPCYCERVVPEFSRRVTRIARQGNVVLSAHSQGTAIAVATVHRLGPLGCDRVGLVTYGSPLERLYARMFPHFFGLDALREARDHVGGRWRNLYRRSDPIGGPVFTLDAEALTCGDPPANPPADPVDRKLVDPRFDVWPGEFGPPPARGHSNYFHDSWFPATVDEVASSIPG